MDGEFECLRGKLTRKGIDLIVCSEDEHVGKIKRLNHTVSKIVRAAYTAVPYKLMLGWMVVELVHFAIFWLNTFPPPQQYVHCSALEH
eukprot:5042746-Ditylum_brightwellii.AAC.1